MLRCTEGLPRAGPLFGQEHGTDEGK